VFESDVHPQPGTAAFPCGNQRRTIALSVHCRCVSQEQPRRGRLLAIALPTSGAPDYQQILCQTAQLESACRRQEAGGGFSGRVWH